MGSNPTEPTDGRTAQGAQRPKLPDGADADAAGRDLPGARAGRPGPELPDRRDHRAGDQPCPARQPDRRGGSRGTGNSDDNGYVLRGCGGVQAYFSRKDVSTASVRSEWSTVAGGTWPPIAGGNDGRALRLYLDARLVGMAPRGNLGPLTSDLYLGRMRPGGFPMVGALDEVKWWTTVRSQAGSCADATGTWTGGSCQL